jgi:phosphoribosylamine---glycine ligase
MNPRIGDVITGLPKDSDDAVVFHAGTTLKDDELQTSGGRVFCVTVLADNVRQAQQRAYEVAHRINFNGAQYRSDIGYRAVKSTAS